MPDFAAAPGSPILARQNTVQIYGLILTTAIIVGFLLFLWFILKKLRKNSTPKWTSKQKNKPTKISNINNVANKYHLSKDERNLLWDMCHRNNTPNIEYLIHDEIAMNNLFRQEYQVLLKQKKQEQIISLFFMLHYKLEHARIMTTVITSSKNIPEDTEFLYTDQNEQHHTFRMIHNKKEGMYLKLSSLFISLPEKPAALAKINLIFILASGIQYAIKTRIIRYQTGLEGLQEMLITHTNNITVFSKRQTKRLTINQKCIFAAVKVGTKKKGNSEVVMYEPLQHRYEGIIVDISAGGCQLITRLPIKIDQYIWMELRMDSLYTDEAIGLIIDTRKNTEKDLYNLHIKFIKISQATQNRIQARVYNYTS